MTMEEISRILLDQGFSFALLTVLMYLFYKFVSVRIEVMKTQLENELKQKKHVISGSIKMNEKEATVDLNIEVLKVENHQG